MFFLQPVCRGGPVLERAPWLSLDVPFSVPAAGPPPNTGLLDVAISIPLSASHGPIQPQPLAR
jgi:hypothetical protein